jgi:hypothetical protein
MHDALQARRFLWFLCLNCGHSARLAPTHLVRFLRDDVRLQDLGHRMKCNRCQRRSAAVIVDDRELPGRD